MKPILTIFICFFSTIAFSQAKQNPETSIQPYQFYLMKPPSDSTVILLTPQNKNVMPNSISAKLPAPKLVGSNGNGQNIYILPIDNMPVIMPDNNFNSNMPVVGGRRKTQPK